jgi:hypothetical protein
MCYEQLLALLPPQKHLHRIQLCSVRTPLAQVGSAGAGLPLTTTGSAIAVDTSARNSALAREAERNGSLLFRLETGDLAAVAGQLQMDFDQPGVAGVIEPEANPASLRPGQCTAREWYALAVEKEQNGFDRRSREELSPDPRRLRSECEDRLRPRAPFVPITPAGTNAKLF